MADRVYYVLCADNCKFEGMTKEQIYAAIAEATGNVPTGIDEAFITRIVEQNANVALGIWYGTEAEYNALEEKPENTLVFFKDSSFEKKVTQEIESLKKQIAEGNQIITSGTEDPTGGEDGDIYIKYEA